MNKYFKYFTLLNVPREYNVKADKLAQGKLQEYIRVKGEIDQALNVLPQILEVYNVVMEDNLRNQPCLICADREPKVTLLLCDRCSQAFDLACVGLETILMDKQYCNNCANKVYKQ